MITTGGRTDIIVQWFSSKFIHDHPKAFDKVVAGPGEIVVFLKNGKVEDVVTSSMCSTDMGLLSRLSDKLKGTDKQIIVADLNPKSICVPFDGYTRDRTHVSGCVNLTVRISADNILRVMNLLKRDAVLDSKWASNSGEVKEITLEDIGNYMSYDTALIVDSSLLSKIDVADIRGDMDAFNAKIRNAIDSMGFSWANSGIAIDFARVDMDDNSYEAAMRYRSDEAKAQMKKDADAEAEIHELGLESDIRVALINNRAREDMASLVAKYEASNYSMDEENAAKLKQLDADAEAQSKQMSMELQKAKDQAEIDRINGLSEDQRKRREIDTRTYGSMADAKVQDFIEEGKTRRTIDVMKAKLDIEVAKAFEDGKQQGKLLAEKDAYDRGYNKGMLDGLQKGVDMGSATATNVVGSTAAALSNRGGEYCPKCRALNPPGYSYCSNCGAKRRWHGALPDRHELRAADHHGHIPVDRAPLDNEPDLRLQGGEGLRPQGGLRRGDHREDEQNTGVSLCR